MTGSFYVTVSSVRIEVRVDRRAVGPERNGPSVAECIGTEALMGMGQALA